ncbi:MAG: hypothetical protein R6U59_05200 [Eubacteriales bacterium]
MQIDKVLKDKYILCICEGNAEKDIMNILLEDGLLIFNREDLIEDKVHKRMSVKKIEDNYLGLSYNKELVILRIIDSRNEKFTLSKAYRDRFKIITAITNPEIEILIVIDKGDYDEFCKNKSKEKPSVFCKRVYSYKGIKRKGFMNDYFKDSKKLLDAIKEHNRYKKSKILTLYD